MAACGQFSVETLVASLAEDVPGADQEFQSLLRKPIQQIVARYLQDDVEAATDAAISWLRKYVPVWALSPDEIRRIDQSPAADKLFIAVCLACLQRLFLWKPSQLSSGNASWQLFDELNSFDGKLSTTARERAVELGIQIDTFLRPRDSLGGDWWMMRPQSESQMWFMIADTQGKSWQAWLKKRCVFLVWERVWRDCHKDPVKLLSKLDQMLNNTGCLPEGFFIEATVGVIGVSGQVTLASSGAGFIFSYRGATEVVFHKLSGPLMGLSMPVPFSSSEFQLSFGESLSCTTDGVPDQPDGDIRLGTVLVDRLRAGAIQNCGLHRAMLNIYESAVAKNGQFDDTTILTLTRADSEDCHGMRM